MSLHRITSAIAISLLAAACGNSTADQAPAAGTAPPVAETRIDPASPQALLSRYEQEAVALASAIGDGRADSQTLAAATALIDIGAELTPAFVARNPACDDYLSAALAIRTKLDTLDAETAERDYHDDAALPTAGIVPACYHMKDLIVHPATAVLLLRQAEPDFKSARHEIDEVIAHVSVVRASL